MATKTEKKLVIFDTDMGFDDAWALQMILKAEKYLKNVQVLAITVVNGNTTVDNVIKNTYHILNGLGRTDVKPILFIFLSEEEWKFRKIISIFLFLFFFSHKCSKLDSNLQRSNRSTHSRQNKSGLLSRCKWIW